MAKARKEKARTALRVFRTKQRMTQGEFAEKIGYTATNYAMIEQGNRQGTQAFWNSLQRAFNIPDEKMWKLTKIDKD